MYMSTVYATTLCLYSPFRKYEDKEKKLIIFVWDCPRVVLCIATKILQFLWGYPNGRRKGAAEEGTRNMTRDRFTAHPWGLQ